MGNDVKVRIGLGVFICFLKKLYLKKILIKLVYFDR